MSEIATLDEVTVADDRDQTDESHEPQGDDPPRSLAQYLDRLKMSERRLAKMLDISQSHLSLIRRGLRTPSVKVAKAISQHTHIPLDDLLRSFTPAVITRKKKQQQQQQQQQHRKHRR